MLAPLGNQIYFAGGHQAQRHRLEIEAFKRLIANSGAEPLKYNSDSFNNTRWKSRADSLPPPTEQGGSSVNNRRDSETDLLLRRTERGDSSVTCVDMGEGQSIEIQPSQEHTLFTYGLCGCQATLIFGKHPNGKKTAILTHYPPTHKFKNLDHIRQLIRQHPDLRDKRVKLTAITLIPGKWHIDPETGKYEQIPEEQSLVNIIQSAIKDELGDQVTELVLPYSMNQSPEKSSTFIIRFPGEAAEPIQYEACGTHYGELGK